MIIHTEPQGSQAWLDKRAGIPSASEADQLITPAGDVRTGELPKRLLATKLAERWMGPLPGFVSWATEQGELLETEALPCLEFEYGIPVKRVGFITNDVGRFGCSPDGLISDTCGLEVKCLQPVHHVACLLAGTLPKEFFAQVHFSMHVTGFPEWKLFLYSRHLPKLLLTIPRDDMVQAKITEALASFLDAFDKGWKRLVTLNSGEDPRAFFAQQLNPTK